jgi:hypothetical protein
MITAMQGRKAKNDETKDSENYKCAEEGHTFV